MFMGSYSYAMSQLLLATYYLYENGSFDRIGTPNVGFGYPALSRCGQEPGRRAQRDHKQDGEFHERFLQGLAGPLALRNIQST